MLRWLLSLCLLVPALGQDQSSTSEGVWKHGEVVKGVVSLDSSNFLQAIQDPANPFWLLKFYAPWCGHCKRLAPVLDQVALIVEGRMAIGKIDCTVEKSLCKQYGVTGYPTLKYSLDASKGKSQLKDYPSGRSQGELVDFANKMTLPPVTSISSMERARKYALDRVNSGVLFIAYHPEAVVKGETDEKYETEDKLRKTYLTQLFSQVARMERASSYFLLLDPSSKSKSVDKDDEKLGETGSTEEDQDMEPFLCRIEPDVPMRCFERKIDNESGVSLEDVHKFVVDNSMPTVSALGPANFKGLSNGGRHLVIGVVKNSDYDEQVEEIRSPLLRYATSESVDRDKYYFGWMDGRRWNRFLEQFEIEKEEMPLFFVLDAPQKQYWKDTSYKLDLENFMSAVEGGRVPPKFYGKKGIAGLFERFYIFLVRNRPWSIVVVVLPIIGLFLLLATLLSPGKELRPPYPTKTGEQASSQTSKKDQ